MTSVPATGILLLHLGLALVALAVVGCMRWWVRRGASHDTPARSLELAYLGGGHRLVVYTALAELRRRRLVRADSRGIIAVPGPALPEGTSALYATVLTAARGPRRIEDLLRDSKVAASAERIGARLVRRGWVLSARQQTRMRWYGTPGWVIALWCLAAFGLTLPHFSEPDRSLQALGLLGLGVFLAIGTYMVVDLPPVTRAGNTVLLRERAELSASASWFRRVAANGEPELWRMDAAFAEQAGAFSGELPKLPLTSKRTFISTDWWHWKEASDQASSLRVKGDPTL
ncbi:TIGR04222 domain-containing membrane protein [Actinoplanes sp. NPDC049599]|uniref:TIGR04222 domain-containing membrane protein n=1 Tax=Actinoplanes sp. NPDC049599 TaxID=3363903 RepID=UPI003790CF66